VSLLRRLVAGFLPRLLGFELGAGDVGFVVDKVSSEYFRFPSWSFHRVLKFSIIRGWYNRPNCGKTTNSITSRPRIKEKCGDDGLTAWYTGPHTICFSQNIQKKRVSSHLVAAIVGNFHSSDVYTLYSWALLHSHIVPVLLHSSIRNASTALNTTQNTE
jgi:hypothetical protein